MKKGIIFSGLICIILAAGCNENKKEETSNEVKTEGNAPQDSSSMETPKDTMASTTISFDELSHDFGKIKEGTVAEYTFKFKNTGNAPLIVSNAKASCGCTVPAWTKEPIQPGQEGTIMVTYNSAGKSGKQNKTVSVFANTNPAETNLSISAEVDNSVKEQSEKGPLNK